MKNTHDIGPLNRTVSKNCLIPDGDAIKRDSSFRYIRSINDETTFRSIRLREQVTGIASVHVFQRFWRNIAQSSEATNLCQLSTFCAHENGKQLISVAVTDEVVRNLDSP